MSRFKKVGLALMGAFFAAGSVYALWTAYYTVTGNGVSAAHIAIQGEVGGNKPADNSGLLPGEWGDYGYVALTNTGERETSVFMYLDNVSGDACAMTVIEIKDKDNHNYSPDYLYSGMVAGLTGETKKLEVTKSLVQTPQDQIGTWVSYLLQPQAVVNIQQKSGLSYAAGNDMMGNGCTWDEVFVAQTKN